eukprot:281337-Amphidinium_carterae.1
MVPSRLYRSLWSGIHCTCGELSGWERWEMRMGTYAMLADSATTRKGRCEYKKATTVRNTRLWRQR